MSIRFFDMFSGIGGFRSGLEAVGGFECVGHCEIDKHANQAYNAIYDIKPQEVYFEDARKINRISTLFAADFLVRHFQLLEGAEVLKIREERCSLKSLGLPPLKDLHICSLKTYPACYRMTEAGRLLPSSVRFLTWGTMSHGRFLTARILESPNPERECILSDILEDDAPAKYFLSEKQMQRLLCKLSPDEKETESTPQAELPSPSQATQAVSEEKQDSTI